MDFVLLHCWVKEFQFLFGLLDPEGDGATLVTTYHDTLSQPRKFVSSAACCKNLKSHNEVYGTSVYRAHSFALWLFRGLFFILLVFMKTEEILF